MGPSIYEVVSRKRREGEKRREEGREGREREREGREVVGILWVVVAVLAIVYTPKAEPACNATTKSALVLTKK